MNSPMQGLRETSTVTIDERELATLRATNIRLTAFRQKVKAADTDWHQNKVTGMEAMKRVSQAILEEERTR